MDKSKRGSFQSLGGGMYRVNGAFQRSAVTGRYVTVSNSQSRSMQQKKAQPVRRKDSK